MKTELPRGLKLSFWFFRIGYKLSLLANGEFQTKYRMGRFLQALRERENISDRAWEQVKQEFRDRGMEFTELPRSNHD